MYAAALRGCNSVLNTAKMPYGAFRLNVVSSDQALWRGTLAGQLLYVPYTTVQFVTLQQATFPPPLALHLPHDWHL